MKQDLSSDSAVFARHVLALNDRGTHTIPAKGVYPHQWLWDSCFVAIGLRHLNAHRASIELRSLVHGQWKNGMLPHMLFSMRERVTIHEEIWDSKRSPDAPSHRATSGMTQPPVIAEAVWLVGQKLGKKERKEFFAYMLPHLIDYHAWLYKERDPHGEGLVLLIHSWESGMDNSPSWTSEIHANRIPAWIRFIDILSLQKLATLFRWDFRTHLSLKQRADTIDELILYSIQRQQRRYRYNIHDILRHSQLNIEDLAFNAILIRANECLRKIAKELEEEVPAGLLSSMHKTPHAMELLWHPDDRQYYSRNYATHELIRVPTISTLLPLYAGTVTQERANELVRMLKNDRTYWSRFPVPTVPKSSPYYNEFRYWQGPSWVNMNWFIIKGLQNYGFESEAKEIRERTLKMVDVAGMREYFDPQTGEGLGAENFSWTAALVLDLLNET